MIGCYCRVSTTDQTPDRQLKSTTEYAQDHLDATPADFKMYRDN
ncbi:MAG: Resolvase, N terminal domain protein [uncultured archaeon A07HR60]|nr:MAG: Resolvase, N terminal domain protein [uncultured archaeon A07HR60]